jgi:hypothetical protein
MKHYLLARAGGGPTGNLQPLPNAEKVAPGLQVPLYDGSLHL